MTVAVGTAIGSSSAGEARLDDVPRLAMTRCHGCRLFMDTQPAVTKTFGVDMLSFCTFKCYKAFCTAKLQLEAEEQAKETKEVPPVVESPQVSPKGVGARERLQAFFRKERPLQLGRTRSLVNLTAPSKEEAVKAKEDPIVVREALADVPAKNRIPLAKKNIVRALSRVVSGSKLSQQR
eukprot:tig00001065_g6723.t1